MYFITPETAQRLEMAQAMRSYYYVQARHRLRSQDACETLPVGGGLALYAWPGAPLNRAQGLGLDDTDAAAAIEAVEAFFARYQTPASFDICPLAGRSFIRQLEQRGYRLQKFFSILVRPLPAGPLPTPPGVSVLPAQPDQAELWIHTTSVGFEESEPPSAAELEMTGPNFYSQNATCFLAWVDDRPAGGGALYRYEDLVELGGTSTRPEFRRRGVQAALIAQRLQAAYAQGCRLAYAKTSPSSDSQRNLQRAGFELAYTKAVLAQGT